MWLVTAALPRPQLPAPQGRAVSGARSSRGVAVVRADPAPDPSPSLSRRRERMEAMEKQIASLTGLVQSALLRGSEADTPR